MKASRRSPPRPRLGASHDHLCGTLLPTRRCACRRLDVRRAAPHAVAGYPRHRERISRRSGVPRQGRHRRLWRTRLLGASRRLGVIARRRAVARDWRSPRGTRPQRGPRVAARQLGPIRLQLACRSTRRVLRRALPPGRGSPHARHGQARCPAVVLLDRRRSCDLRHGHASARGARRGSQANGPARRYRSGLFRIPVRRPHPLPGRTRVARRRGRASLGGGRGTFPVLALGRHPAGQAPAAGAAPRGL